MGSKIYPEVHENPRAFFSSSSPILLEPLAHGSGNWPFLGRIASQREAMLKLPSMYQGKSMSNNVATDDPLCDLIKSLYDIYEKPVELLWDRTKFGIPNLGPIGSYLFCVLGMMLSSGSIRCSHVQSGGFENGYYVMHWMWNIVRGGLKNDWTMWFGDGTPLNVETITTIRKKWATYFVKVKNTKFRKDKSFLCKKAGHFAGKRRSSLIGEVGLMAKVCWPYFDPEYENFTNRMNPPRVSVDNASFHDCTLIKMDSVNKPGILLEVVQILTDLDFIITKAYISSDRGIVRMASVPIRTSSIKR
ncbi:ACT domain-containing protein ACR3 [Glycine soja]|nr:ACT domain-containing protein ACR3 [Glycine soja]